MFTLRKYDPVLIIRTPRSYSHSTRRDSHPPFPVTLNMHTITQVPFLPEGVKTTGIEIVAPVAAHMSLSDIQRIGLTIATPVDA